MGLEKLLEDLGKGAGGSKHIESKIDGKGKVHGQ